MRLTGVQLQLHTFLTSKLDGGERSNSRPGRFIPRGRSPQLPIWWEAGWSSEPERTRWRREKFPSPFI